MEYQWNGNGQGMHGCNSTGYWQPRPMFQYQPTRHFPPPQQIWNGFQGNPWEQPYRQFNPGPIHHVRHQFPNNHKNNKKTKSRGQKEQVFIDFCDVCDRGFKTEAKKNEHFSQHIKCDEPGCKFEAHFKIVFIHKQNAHGPNAHKIKLDTPEEIARWRMERRKNYPTAANAELKLKKSQERLINGNVLNNKEFGKMRKRKGCNKSSVDKNSNLTEAFQPGKVAKTEDNDKRKHTNLLISNGSDDLSDSDSLNESMDTEMVSDSNMKANLSVGLGSLMQSYASDSDEEKPDSRISVGNVDMKTVFPKDELPDASFQSENNIQSNEPTKKGKVSSPGTVQKENREYQSPRRNRSNGQNFVRKNMPKNKRKNLLEMLLAPDIRRERNHILQCVRFIVQNNFFENDDHSIEN
uniref:nuclear fragile X mental retardation-interacting protein 1-like n=1 Tax=Styela clava TaxID=7725 RepID=UPI00193A6EDC|nr:nuclear fragile X mental retardation-interacting protein 1-like [Styela clava]